MNLQSKGIYRRERRWGVKRRRWLQQSGASSNWRGGNGPETGAFHKIISSFPTVSYAAYYLSFQQTSEKRSEGIGLILLVKYLVSISAFVSAASVEVSRDTLISGFMSSSGPSRIFPSGKMALDRRVEKLTITRKWSMIAAELHCKCDSVVQRGTFGDVRAQL